MKYASRMKTNNKLNLLEQHLWPTTINTTITIPCASCPTTRSSNNRNGRNMWGRKRRSTPVKRLQTAECNDHNSKMYREWVSNLKYNLKIGHCTQSLASFSTSGGWMVSVEMQLLIWCCGALQTRNSAFKEEWISLLFIFMHYVSEIFMFSFSFMA